MKTIKRGDHRRNELSNTPALKSGGYPGQWVGRFIWDGGDGNPFHYFLMFRKTFEVKRKIKAVALHITVADRYLLYVNGKQVGRGPARSVGPQWTSYDTHDLVKFLKSGRNVIAVLAYHYGCMNAYSGGQRAGLWAQLEARDTGGKIETTGSNNTWRVRAMCGYRRNSRPVGLGMPGEIRPVNTAHGCLTEILEADKDPAGWMNADFDDSAWETAQEIIFGSCWSYLEPRLTPQLNEREVLPVSVVKTGEARELPRAHTSEIVGANDVPERLACEPHFPLEYAEIKNPEAVLTADERPASFRSSAFKPRVQSAVKGARDPFIIIDFGTILVGYPRLELEAPAGAVIEMTYGCFLVDGRVPAYDVLNGSRFGDGYICREGQQTWQLFETKCFRYVQVVVRNALTPVRIHCIRAVSSEYPAERIGHFECSEPNITSLWEAGVNTVFLHMQDTVEFDPPRERNLYLLVGETEQIHLAITAAFGDLPITDWHFRQTSRMQLADGRLMLHMRGGYPSLGFPKQSLPLMPYNPMTITNASVSYAHAVRNRFFYTGRREFLDEHYPALVRIAQWYERHADDTGLLNNLPPCVWLDWVKNDLRGISFAINALYAKMLDDMAEIAGWLELPRDVEKWKARAANVRATIRRLHWNARYKLFADCVVDGKRSEIFTELSNTMALLYDIADADQSAAIMRRLTARNIKTEVVADNEWSSPYKQKAFPDGLKLTCPSPLYAYYKFEGLTKSGGGEYALQDMSESFEAIVKNTNPPFLTEMCPIPGAEYSVNSPVHGGSAGVTWFLSTRVLGIEATSPGFAQCRIQPIVGLLKWAKGALPTVRGDIHVSWKRDGKGITLEAVIPDGLETEIILPRGNSQRANIKHNGRPAKSADMLWTKSGAGVRVRGGKHTVRVTEAPH